MNKWDTTGRQCALIGRKCPGRGIFHPKGGCPEWCDGEPMEHTVGGIKTDEVFRGCQRLILRPLLRGVDVSQAELAASFDQARNELSRVGFGAMQALRDGVTQALGEAVNGQGKLTEGEGYP